MIYIWTWQVQVHVFSISFIWVITERIVLPFSFMSNLSSSMCALWYRRRNDLTYVLFFTWWDQHFLIFFNWFVSKTTDQYEKWGRGSFDKKFLKTKSRRMYFLLRLLNFKQSIDFTVLLKLSSHPQNHTARYILASFFTSGFLFISCLSPLFFS